MWEFTEGNFKYKCISNGFSNSYEVYENGIFIERRRTKNDLTLKTEEDFINEIKC